MKKNYLFYFACVITLLYIFSNYDKIEEDDILTMKKAAINMQHFSVLIREEKLKRNIHIDKNLDPNLTGLIGEEFTEITTTLGNIESKRTSVNPDFSALFFKLLKEKGIQKNDRIAVNMSSSFPALNLSLISAMDILEVKGIIITSLGASTYGANNINFTYLDMENFLLEKNLIKNYSLAYSLGGDNDCGNNFQEDFQNYFKNKNFYNNRKFFFIDDLTQNINERVNFYGQFGEIKLFINIGGNLVSDSLLKIFQNRKVPTLSLINIRSFASTYGIPIDSVPFPPIGTTSIYFKKNKLFFIKYIVLGNFLFYLFFLYYKKKNIKKSSRLR